MTYTTLTGFALAAALSVQPVYAQAAPTEDSNNTLCGALATVTPNHILWQAFEIKGEVNGMIWGRYTAFMILAEIYNKPEAAKQAQALLEKAYTFPISAAIAEANLRAECLANPTTTIWATADEVARQMFESATAFTEAA